MQKLLVYAGLPLESDLAARTGGRPLAPVTMDWPVCRTCMGAMQFVGQVPLTDSFAQVVSARPSFCGSSLCLLPRPH